MSEPPPVPTAISVSSKAFVDACAILLPIATAAAQFLKTERSYEVIFLAACVTLLYFGFRGLRSDLDTERRDHAATRKSCDENEARAQADLATVSERYQTRIAEIQDRRKVEISTMQASLINVFNDLSLLIPPGDRNRIGHFAFNSNTQLVEYMRPSVATQSATITISPAT